MQHFGRFDDILKDTLDDGQGELCHPFGSEVLPLWEWLPATIPSRQDAAPTQVKKKLHSEAVYGARRHPDLERSLLSPPLAKGAGGI